MKREVTGWQWHQLTCVSCIERWRLSSVAGNVYNITAYVDFHPGGSAELMRGAGIDCSELFDEVSRRSVLPFIQSVVHFALPM